MLKNLSTMKDHPFMDPEVLPEELQHHCDLIDDLRLPQSNQGVQKLPELLIRCTFMNESSVSGCPGEPLLFAFPLT